MPLSPRDGSAARTIFPSKSTFLKKLPRLLSRRAKSEINLDALPRFVMDVVAAARLAAGAAAPFAFAAAMHQIGIGLSLFATAALGTLGIGAFVLVAIEAGRHPVAAE